MLLTQPRSRNLCEQITYVVNVIIINVIVNVIIIISLMYMETVNEFNFMCNTF